MSEAQTAAQAAATPAAEGPSFLDQVVAATKQTAPDQAQDLVKNLVQQALAGTVTFDEPSDHRGRDGRARDARPLPSGTARNAEKQNARGC